VFGLDVTEHLPALQHWLRTARFRTGLYFYPPPPRLPPFFSGSGTPLVPVRRTGEALESQQSRRHAAQYRSRLFGDVRPYPTCFGLRIKSATACFRLALPGELPLLDFRLDFRSTNFHRPVSGSRSDSSCRFPTGPTTGPASRQTGRCSATDKKEG